MMASRQTLRAMMRSMRIVAPVAGPSARRCASTKAAIQRATSYPYSPDAHIPVAVPFVSTRRNVQAPPEPKSIYSGVMTRVQSDLRARYDPGNQWTKLFDRNTPERIPPGSVLVVETWTSAAKTNFSSFSGIVIAIRRRGISTSFRLRNLVHKLGVEQVYRIYSPLLKDVKVIQRATAGKNDKSGALRRTRRAKLYYLRNDDRRLAGIANTIRVHRAKEDSKLNTSRGGAKQGAPASRDRASR